MRDKFSRFSCYTFKMKIFRIFIVTCSLINLLYKKRCQKCLMFWQYQFQNDHQSVSLSLYMYLKQIKAHGPLAFLNYREMKLIWRIFSFLLYSNETSWNSREIKFNKTKRQKLVCSASLCYIGRWTVRRLDVVNVQSQILTCWSFLSLCITYVCINWFTFYNLSSVKICKKDKHLVRKYWRGRRSLAPVDFKMEILRDDRGQKKEF